MVPNKWIRNLALDRGPFPSPTLGAEGITVTAILAHPGGSIVRILTRPDILVLSHTCGLPRNGHHLRRGHSANGRLALMELTPM